MTINDINSQDLIYNHSLSSGWLVSILKTRRARQKNKGSKNKNATDSDEPDLEPETEYSDADAEADMLYLKQTPYSKDTEREIKERLKRSAAHRQVLMQDANSNIISDFPYLFLHPDLVIFLVDHFVHSTLHIEMFSTLPILFDFVLTAGAKSPDGFVNEWPFRSQKISNVMQLYSKKVQTKFDQDIKTILMLLKMLPFTPHRAKNQPKRAPAAYVPDCFIEFIKVEKKLPSFIFLIWE